MTQNRRSVFLLGKRKVSIRFTAAGSRSRQNLKHKSLRLACVKDCTKEHTACASRLFFLNQPIVSLICDVVVSIVAVVFKLPVNDEQNELLFYSVFVSLTGG